MCTGGLDLGKSAGHPLLQYKGLCLPAQQYLWEGREGCASGSLIQKTVFFKMGARSFPVFMEYRHTVSAGLVAFSAAPTPIPSPCRGQGSNSGARYLAGRALTNLKFGTKCYRLGEKVLPTVLVLGQQVGNNPLELVSRDSVPSPSSSVGPPVTGDLLTRRMESLQ